MGGHGVIGKATQRWWHDMGEATTGWRRATMGEDNREIDWLPLDRAVQMLLLLIFFYSNNNSYGSLFFIIILSKSFF